jgi:hypothetical protein
MDTTDRTTLELTHELWVAYEHACCPYAHHDDRGCWCASPVLPEAVDRYLLCNPARLQLWCCTEDHYTRCHFYSADDMGCES